MYTRAGAGFLLAVVLSVSLLGCEDTKARQENERLKAQVLELQKENGDLGNHIDVLTKENATLKDENERLKAKHPRTKTRKRKHHRTSSTQAPSGQN
jgi:regulator of replication initiation timing